MALLSWLLPPLGFGGWVGKDKLERQVSRIQGPFQLEPTQLLNDAVFPLVSNALVHARTILPQALCHHHILPTETARFEGLLSVS